MTIQAPDLYAVYETSGILWIFLTLFMLYLTYEHVERNKFPQNVIIFLLAINMAVRCIWFFNYIKHGDLLIMLIANRTAILLQFSALSILILMWIRALHLTAMADKIERLSITTQALETPVNASQATSIMGGGKGDNTSNNRLSTGSTRSSSAETERQVKIATERQQQQTVRAVLLLNVVVWLIILVSLVAEQSNLWYDINIIAISVLCLLQAVFTLGIGLRTAIAMNKELSPVLISNMNDFKQDRPGQRQWLKQFDCCGCASLYSIYKLFFSREGSKNGLQLQRQVLKTIIGVSLVIFIFYFLRSLSFLSRPVLGE